MGKDYKIGIKIGGQLESSFANAINGAKSGLNGLNLLAKGGKALFKATTGVLGASMVGLGTFGTYSVKTAADFEQAINSAGATAGATGADFQMMKQAAIDMGRSTSKTAAESANALEFMALAGWDAQTSVKALPGVLKLSEATGLDLARTSDLITDSMSAAGFAVDDLGHYLDVLSVAQTRSNQTVDQLMEAYIGVGGQLRNLNVPMETGATMLGLLANNGLKGAEGSTALNAILANMTATTGKSAKAMSQLGISMYDSQGRSRDLREVFGDVNKALSGMTEEQRNMYLGMIGGKEHVKAMNALISGLNDTTADGTLLWDSLAASIENADGSFERFHSQKTDNLLYNVELLKSAFQELGRTFGDSLIQKGPLNDLVKGATAAINQLTSAFQRGGFSELAKSFGNQVANFIPRIMDLVPDFIECSTQLVEAVLTGIENNVDRIGQGAGAIIAKLGEAIIRIAPRLVVVGAKLIVQIGKGIIDHLPELGHAVQEIGAYLGRELKSLFTSEDTSPIVKAFAGIAAVGGGVGIAGAVINKISSLASKVKPSSGSKGGGLLSGFTKMLFGKGGGLDIMATLKTIGSVSLVVSAIAGLSSAFGWLNNNIAGFKENLQSGAEVAGLIGEFIGSFVGGAIGGAIGMAADVITSKLPGIANSLTAFAQNMEPFFQAIDGMDTGKLSSFAAALTQMLLVVAGNEMLSLVNRFTGGGDSLGQLATQLNGFVDQITPVFDKLASMNQAGIDAAPKVFGSLGALGNVAFNSGGLLQAITGELDLAGVGKQLSAFAESAAPAFDRFASMNTAGIDNVPKVFQGLSSIGGYEFKSGGFAQLFSGEVDLAGIGKQLSAFAETALPAFDQFASLNAAGIDNVPKVFEGLSKIGGYEFKSGGLAQLFTGSTDISNIGEQLGRFGDTALPAIAKFADLNPAGIDNIPKLFEGLSKIAGYEFKSGGFAQLFTGGVDLAGLGSQLSNFASSSRTFFDLVGTLDTSSMSNVTQIFDTLEQVGQSATSGGLSQLKSADLGGIAAPLTQLVDGLIPFFQKAGQIDLSAFDSVRQMFASLQEVGALVSTANISGGNLAAFGQELVQFIDSFSQFSAKLGGMEGGAAGISSFVGSLSTLSNGLQQVSGGVTSAAGAIRTELTGLTSAISEMNNVGTAGFTGLTSSVAGSMNQMTAGVTNGANQMQTSFTNMMSRVTSAVTNGMSRVASAVRNGMNQAVSAARSGAQSIANAFKGINLSTAGAQMMQGLVNGINSKKGAVQSAARNLAQTAQQAVNAAMKIASPSRVMIETGRYIGEGLEIGMIRQTPAVSRQAEAMAQPILQTVQLERRAISRPWSIESTGEHDDIAPAGRKSTKSIREFVAGRQQRTPSEKASAAQVVEITYAPNITVNGGGPDVREQVMEGERLSQREFDKMLMKSNKNLNRVKFA